MLCDETATAILLFLFSQNDKPYVSNIIYYYIGELHIFYIHYDNNNNCSVYIIIRRACDDDEVKSRFIELLYILL